MVHWPGAAKTRNCPEAEDTTSGGELPGARCGGDVSRPLRQLLRQVRQSQDLAGELVCERTSTRFLLSIASTTSWRNARIAVFCSLSGVAGGQPAQLVTLLDRLPQLADAVTTR